MPRLTIGMATYGDFDGVFFTIQSLRMYHDIEGIEIIIVDNKGDDRLKDWVDHWCRARVRYYRHTDVIGTTVPRDLVFEYAQAERVICMDSHVMLYPGALDRLWDDDSLIHGPMAYDDLSTYVTHMRDEWRDNMWGVWADGVKELPSEPFEIPMHGLGLFGSRKDTWLGLNRDFRGFGGEEGYIHEKYRKAGRKVMCLPWMKWCHRFGARGDYPLKMEDRVRNYLIGFNELGLDPQPIIDHFGVHVCNRSWLAA